LIKKTKIYEVPKLEVIVKLGESVGMFENLLQNKVFQKHKLFV
jgi:hypothetical protein